MTNHALTDPLNQAKLLHQQIKYLREFSMIPPANGQESEIVNMQVKIPAYPNYFATANGDIWGRRRWRGRGRLKLTPYPNAKGYPTVDIFINSKKTCVTVNKLVMLTFVGPRPAGMEVRHLDGNKQNNKLDNLAYGTPQENADDRIRLGELNPRNGEDNGMHRLTVKDVVFILQEHAKGTKAADIVMKLAHRRVIISRDNIHRICRGEAWEHVDRNEALKEKIADWRRLPPHVREAVELQIPITFGEK